MEIGMTHERINEKTPSGGNDSETTILGGMSVFEIINMGVHIHVL